ncbi:MAG: hypothetical protein ACLGHX_00860 [Acidimicrobiia bacterium]
MIQIERTMRVTDWEPRHADGAWRAVTGDDGPWGAAVPSLHRVLNAPDAGLPFLVAVHDVPDHEHQIAYWHSLLYMLIYSLGWSRPDRGLHWWLTNQHPTDDPRLALLDRVWHTDGHLPHFLAWLIDDPGLVRPIDLTPATTEESIPLDVDRAWLSEGLANAPSPEVSGWGGGSDPHHLSVHIHVPIEDTRTDTAVLLRSGTDQRRAALIVDGFLGWYRILHVLGTDLPGLGTRSWHVDVTVRATGFLGTYRRSRQTGRWFAGPHSLHILGN